MTSWRRTYRDVDGQRVDGTWRPVFTRNGDTYYLADLVIYADGAIDSGVGGLTDPDGLRAQLESGEVATELEDGVRAQAHHLASWRFADALAWVDARMLLGEVADEIDRLNDRPDSTARCMLALRAYLSDLTEANRLALLDSYLAIPEHLRVYALGDMDYRDEPLRILATPMGAPIPDDPAGRRMTERLRDQAIGYFRQRDDEVARWESTVPADGPAKPESPTLTLRHTGYPRGWPADPGVQALQLDHPAPISVGGRIYPTVTHAYWALSTTDADWRDRIAAAGDGFDAARLAEQAPRHPQWTTARLAVMAGLLREKCRQHPQVAEALLGTGDARIVYIGVESPYWVSAGPGDGTNWIGRLLELVRSELAAAAAGLR